jgi:hypothetical protein
MFAELLSTRQNKYRKTKDEKEKFSFVLRFSPKRPSYQIWESLENFWSFLALVTSKTPESFINFRPAVS